MRSTITLDRYVRGSFSTSCIISGHNVPDVASRGSQKQCGPHWSCYISCESDLRNLMASWSRDCSPITLQSATSATREENFRNFDLVLHENADRNRTSSAFVISVCNARTTMCARHVWGGLTTRPDKAAHGGARPPDPIGLLPCTISTTRTACTVKLLHGTCNGTRARLGLFRLLYGQTQAVIS